MKFLLMSMLAVGGGLRAQPAPTPTIDFVYEYGVEKRLIGDVYREAAMILVEGFKGAMRSEIPRQLRGNLKEGWTVFIFLTPRDKPFDPQFIEVFIRPAASGGQRKLLHRFQLGLETNLLEQAKSAVTEIAKVVKPEPLK
jgi:hypothetical protein